MINKIRIDLNLDAGESLEALQNGSEEKLYQYVTSVNIACGGHAGDEKTMAQAVQLSMKFGLAIGAHPSFPDREGFGRNVLQISKAELVDSLVQQIESLRKVCLQFGAQMRHVKPHGALYNLVAQDFSATQTLIEAIRQVDPTFAVVGLAGSPFLKWSAEAGLKPIAEAFTDRRYESDGTLRSRKFEDALIQETQLAADQALQIVRERRVRAIDGNWIAIEADTLCVHGDSPRALETVQEVSQALKSAGVELKSAAPTSKRPHHY